MMRRSPRRLPGTRPAGERVHYGRCAEPLGWHARLFAGGIDAILLDLFVPGSQGIDSFDEVFLAARRIAIVVLTEQDQEEVAREAVQRGAKDRVLKRPIDSNTFSLILRDILDLAAADDALFIERERAQVTLNSIGDAVISTDKSGYVTYVNPAPFASVTTIPTAVSLVGPPHG
jgi:DNA-binding NarL/FixJ family response regulator